jgi:hypothetical protein
MSKIRTGLIIGLGLALAYGAAAMAQQPDRSKPARAEFACLTSAREDFQNAKLALLKDSVKRTIETLVSERRVEEQYCLRIARCVARTETGPAADLQAPIEFSNCLEEVSLEKYDAKKRGE